ncbi:hypothetical protein LZ32DRAFT_661701 [Colletotrichum eremochloae]|nr:hypothetical protein LZ32DRAFT_661701 [Colletotrichum eremochloae]
MKVTLAPITVFATLAVAQSTTFLCNDIGGKVIQDAGICTGAGGKELGKGICCIANAVAESKFDIACDDANGTSQNTNNPC